MCEYWKISNGSQACHIMLLDCLHASQNDTKLSKLCQYSILEAGTFERMIIAILHVVSLTVGIWIYDL